MFFFLTKNKQQNLRVFYRRYRNNEMFTCVIFDILTAQISKKSQNYFQRSQKVIFCKILTKNWFNVCRIALDFSQFSQVLDQLLLMHIEQRQTRCNSNVNHKLLWRPDACPVATRQILFMLWDWACATPNKAITDWKSPGLTARAMTWRLPPEMIGMEMIHSRVGFIINDFKIFRNWQTFENSEKIGKSSKFKLNSIKLDHVDQV